MTIKHLPGQEPEKAKKAARGDDEDKLIIREYIKRAEPKDGTPFIVEKAKLTQNGWLLIETTDWVGFINGKSKVALALLNDIAPVLHNQEANALVALVARKNKFGFILATDDDIKRWYSWDAENFTLLSTEEQDQSFLLPTGTLTLADFIGTVSSSLNDVGQPPVELSKAKSRTNNSRKDTTES